MRDRTEERFIIAGPCPATRAGIARFVGDAGVEVVGEAGDTEEMLQLASELCPDRVVLDPRFDDGAPDPLAEAELCKRLKDLTQPPSISVYSAHDSPAELALLARAGADHYVHKGTSY